jgi:LPXTG-site transpeptidase (sortase) family protein
MRWLANALIALGAVVLIYAGAWQFGLAPGSRVTLPEPVALARTPTPARPGLGAPADLAEGTPAALVEATPEPLVGGTAQPVETEKISVAESREATQAEPQPTATPLAVMPVPWIAPDAADRAADAAYPAPGYAVRLAIPAIKLDTSVKQGGIVEDANGNPIWQTVPFVAVHYGDLTALVGDRGNAVIAGHVVTLSEGNVFRFLYQVDIGDQVKVWDQRDKLHTFSVADVKLVPPSDVSVMDPTPDPTLTLITCGGTFDPVKREFSHRLIVIAKREPS